VNPSIRQNAEICLRPSALERVTVPALSLSLPQGLWTYHNQRIAAMKCRIPNGLVVAKLLLAVRRLYSSTVAFIRIENLFGFVLLLVRE
jgi:hypothetical protein